MDILIQIVSGIVGGNVAGTAQKAKLGPMLNTVLGALGGVGGGQLAVTQMGAGTATEIGASAVVGALLPLIVGMLKKKT